MENLTDIKKVLRERVLKKTAIGANVAISILLLAALVFMLNFISFRHYWRWDLSRSRFYNLSEKSKSLLSGLAHPVDVVVFYQPGQTVFEDVENLLKEYEYSSKMVRVLWVDPDRDLARAERLAHKYQVDQANVIVVESEGRSKQVKVTELYDYDRTPMRRGEGPAPVAFKGEQVFSSAIQSVTQARKPVVYFLTGHGEPDIEDFDQQLGYSRIAREMRRDNIDVRKLQFGESREVPEDADALIIAGPKKPLAALEIEQVKDYLDHNGRLMALVDYDSDTGLEPLLENWGVAVGKDLVIDKSRTLTGREIFVSGFGEHPITEKMKGITSIFYLPRSVEPIAGSDEVTKLTDKPRAVSLAMTSEMGWAAKDPEEGSLKFRPGEDRPGPISLAVAVEKGPVPGIDVRIRPTRLVVFGDSEFVANASMTGGDLDFFMSALNWLLERQNLMAISPRPLEESRLIIDQRQRHILFWLVVVAMPTFTGIVGAFIAIRRRA